MPSGAVVEVPIMDDLAAFTGDFVLDIDRAWDLCTTSPRRGRPTLWVSGVSCSRKLVRRS